MKDLVPMSGGIQVDDLLVDYDLGDGNVSIYGPMGDLWGVFDIATLHKIVEVVAEAMRVRLVESEMKEKETGV